MPMRYGRGRGISGVTFGVALWTVGWCSMPMRYGRGCGVTRVTSSVALWIEDWCRMPSCYGSGRGVIRVTCWLALWTEDPPPWVSIAELPILCAPAGAAYPRAVAMEVGSLD